jgi:hypothetical protein
MGALSARYCGWPIGEALAVLVIHFASGLIRKRFSDPTLMLARATRQTSRLFGGKVSHI